MSKENFTEKLSLSILVVLAIIFLILTSREPANGILVFSAVALGILLFHNQLAGLCALLFVRPLLDLSSAKSVLEFGSFELNFASVLGLTVTGSFLIILFLKKNQIKTIPLFKMWVIFVIFAILSLAFSISPSLSIAEILRILTIFAAFILGYLASKKYSLEKIIKTIVFSSIIPASFAFYQFFTKTGFSLSFEDIPNRVFGTFAHPNPFAYFSALALSLALAYAIKQKNRQRFFAALHVIMLGLAIGLTYTRGAWLVVAGIVFLAGIIKFRKLLLLAILGIFAMYILVTPFHDRVNSLVIQGPSSSIAWRISLWIDSLSYVTERPILGHGVGTAEEVILDNRGDDFGSTIPHNDYLRMALDIGVFGFAAYLYLFVSAIILLWKKYRSTSQTENQTIILFLSCFATLLFFASAIDNIFEASALQIAFWSSVGAVLAKNENK